MSIRVRLLIAGVESLHAVDPGLSVGQLISLLGANPAEQELWLSLDENSGSTIKLDEGAKVVALVKDLELLVLKDTPRPASVAPVQRPGGHLFVVQSDIRQVRCDAWMVPTSGGWMGVLHHWVPEWVSDVSQREPQLVDLASEPCAQRQFIGTVRRWPTRAECPQGDGQPPPYVCNLPTNVDQLTRACREFVEQAAADLKRTATAPRFRRATHVVALPLVGTGMGGYRNRVARVSTSILPALREEAQRAGVDVALVVFEHSHFIGVQQWRKSRSLQEAPVELSDADRQKAEQLAQLATEGRLALFIGAGVSMGAGLPSWGSLLQHLAEKASMDKTEIAELWKLGDYLDMASIICHRLGGLKVLRQTVAERCQCQGFGLTHALIATIPCSAFVTQNYDDLLEKAAACINRGLAVMPYEDIGDRRFLLKMHGCINFPDDIVLTRQDYLRYEGRRAALSAVVQTLLVTKHMCFLGFSLTDANFHKAIDSIEKAFVSAPNNRPLGTAVVLSSTPFTKALHPNIGVHAMRELAPGQSPAASGALDARKHEIFLDYVGILCASTTGHLLDPAFKTMLSDDQLAFVDFLYKCLNDAPVNIDLPEYALFRKMIRETFGSGYFQKTNKPTYFERYRRISK